MTEKQQKELNDLAKAVKTIFGHNPKEQQHRPDNPPPKTEMSRCRRIDTPPPPPKNDFFGQ